MKRAEDRVGSSRIPHRAWAKLTPISIHAMAMKASRVGEVAVLLLEQSTHEIDIDLELGWRNAVVHGVQRSVSSLRREPV